MKVLDKAQKKALPKKDSPLMLQIFILTIFYINIYKSSVYFETMLERTPGLFETSLLSRAVVVGNVNYALVHVGFKGFDRVLLNCLFKGQSRFAEMRVAKSDFISERVLSFESVEQAIGYMQDDKDVLERLRFIGETYLKFPFSSCISGSGKATFRVHELEPYRKLVKKPSLLIIYDNGEIETKSCGLLSYVFG